jgi:hypothetical protein
MKLEPATVIVVVVEALLIRIGNVLPAVLKTKTFANSATAVETLGPVPIFLLEQVSVWTTS